MYEKFDIGSESLEQIFKKRLMSSYAKLVLNVKGSNRDEILNILIFSITYIVHYILFMTFPYNKSEFTIRFVLDCYHISFFLVFGIYLSDSFIIHNFERFFTIKFLEY